MTKPRMNHIFPSLYSGIKLGVATIFSSIKTQNLTARLFLHQQVDVVDSERVQLLVWAVEVKEETAKGNENSPGKHLYQYNHNLRKNI